MSSSEQFLRSIVENIPDMVFVKDAEELRFVRFNSAGAELIGYPAEEMIGKNDWDLFPASEAAFFIAKDREVLAGGTMVDIPAEPIDTRFRGRRILHTKKIPILGDDGEPEYLLGISEDITDRIEADRAFEAAQREAEEANRARSDFLSRMSHELRTPLNAVLGFAQILEMDLEDPVELDHVRQIRLAGSHLLDLINELLDISRSEAGLLEVSLESVDAAGLIEQAMAVIRPEADERSIQLVAHPAAAARIRTDPRRFRQVLVNILSNAVRFNSEGGSVTVTTELRGAPHDRGRGSLRISVTDTGRGIDPADIDRLFEPYERLGADRSEVGGSGLGLALSKALCDALGADLGVETDPGRGCRFTICVPLADEPRSGSAETPR